MTVPSKFNDCMSIINDESLCSELENRSKKSRSYKRRSGESVDPRALVTKSLKVDGVRLPAGWLAMGGGRYKKRLMNRFAIVWKRGEVWRIQLLYMNMPYMPATGRLTYESAVDAVYIAETFLNDTDSGEFSPLAEGRAVMESGGNELKPKFKSIREIARRSVGIGASPPQITPALRRVKPKPRGATNSGAIAAAVRRAIAPLAEEVARLNAKVESGRVARSGKPSTRPVDYDRLAKLVGRNAPKVSRQAPARSPNMVMRRVAGSVDASTGNPRYAQTVRSVARRSVGLSGYKPRNNFKGFNVRSAIGVEASKAGVGGQVPPTNGTPPNQIGVRDPMTGLTFVNRAALEHWRQANLKDPDSGVPWTP